MFTIKSKTRALTLVFVLTTLGAARECRGAEDSQKKQATSDALAVAQFTNGRFQVIYLNGRVQEFENRAYFFGASRFSADGQAIVGILDRDLVVLNQSFEILWKVRPRHLNIWNMALSPSKTQVAFIGMAGGSRFSLGLIKSSGEELTLATFDRRDGDDSMGLSWSPDGDRLVYGSEGRVKIINVSTMVSETLSDGFEPTWSTNGKWITYRRVDGRPEVYDVSTRQRSLVARGHRIASKVHWAPDSEYVMVVEGCGEKPTLWCLVRTRFVVYGLVDGSKRKIFSPGWLRDWYFDWITDPAKWVSGMKPLP